MRVITIQKYPSMPWRYKIVGETGTRRRLNSRDANDPSEAAAVAIEYARALGGPYVIVGPKIVMDFIPAEVRSRG